MTKKKKLREEPQRNHFYLFIHHACSKSPTKKRKEIGTPVHRIGTLHDSPHYLQKEDKKLNNENNINDCTLQSIKSPINIRRYIYIRIEGHFLIDYHHEYIYVSWKPLRNFNHVELFLNIHLDLLTNQPSLQHLQISKRKKQHYTMTVKKD